MESEATTIVWRSDAPPGPAAIDTAMLAAVAAVATERVSRVVAGVAAETGGGLVILSCSELLRLCVCDSIAVSVDGGAAIEALARPAVSLPKDTEDNTDKLPLVVRRVAEAAGGPRSSSEAVWLSTSSNGAVTAEREAEPHVPGRRELLPVAVARVSDLLSSLVVKREK